MDPEEGAPKSVAELLEEIRKGLESLGNSLPPAVAPTVAPAAPALSAGVADQGIQAPSRSPILTVTERQSIQSELRKRTTNELYSIFTEQARRKDAGVPFEYWLSRGGNALSQGIEEMQRSQLSPDVAKLLDTGGASALIRTDLEPVLYELFIRSFPAYDRFSKIPANGLVHTWNRITSFGDAQFMSELGTVTDDKSTYERANTNVAILATRRGVSLKSQFATIASGSGFNPEQIEMQGGLRSIAHKMQKTIFSGQSADSGGDASNELGTYDADGFTGLRSWLNTSRGKDADPLAGTPDDMRQLVNKACVEIMQVVTGSGPGVAYLDPVVKEIIDSQQDKNVRYNQNLVDVGVGVTTNVLNTVFGPLPLFPVPGDSIGSYTRSGTKRSDIYIVDESSVALPYLGSPGPTVLDIPIGISGQLTHLFIIFLMNGLQVTSELFSNKVRVKVP